MYSSDEELDDAAPLVGTTRDGSVRPERCGDNLRASIEHWVNGDHDDSKSEFVRTGVEPYREPLVSNDTGWFRDLEQVVNNSRCRIEDLFKGPCAIGVLECCDSTRVTIEEIARLVPLVFRCLSGTSAAIGDGDREPLLSEEEEDWKD
eukprot:TRINITY_DN4689_c0_g1_i1.p1 TRINITY_DN4689_c0_g1~~TRINITY_DN4689_c0_g1_i1.p1  ORF type:complete len:148 (-),score=13.10 TRINITY_DN4689_c0_g1_i1:101-544(-)